MVSVATQQGYIYEKNVKDFLQPMGLVPKNYTASMANKGKSPDITLFYDNKLVGCELKMSTASAGSLVMKFNPKDGWSFNPLDDATDKEKIVLSEIADQVGLWKTVNAKWNHTPFKIDKKYQDVKWKAIVGRLSKQDQYRRDKEAFPELKGDIPTSKIEQYYNMKNTFYINVGTHGFYLLGNKNPLNLTGVPRFSDSASACYRARVQPKGGGSYQFTFEMNFGIKKKSPFNIAPLRKGSSAIVEKDADLRPFKDLYK